MLGGAPGRAIYSGLEKEIKDWTFLEKHLVAFCNGCPLLYIITGLCSEGLKKAKSIRFTTFLGNNMAV